MKDSKKQDRLLPEFHAATDPVLAESLERQQAEAFRRLVTLEWGDLQERFTFEELCILFAALHGSYFDARKALHVDACLSDAIERQYGDFEAKEGASSGVDARRLMREVAKLSRAAQVAIATWAWSVSADTKCRLTPEGFAEHGLSCRTSA